ncbi:hypothetical protein GCM10008025_32890 [Ornithinibacillus halotolerans]|uniref:Uncharacterized protein n=1 Tax=Ornithinibacillus halotolerans TaxID=1274357 RepID=A0A916S7T9_9BACI|nr:hypothetical protein GCM10008025_32890 [Ornithinibacillus halotolerans]
MGNSAHTTFNSIKKATIPTLVLTNRFKGSEQIVHSQQYAPLVDLIFAFFVTCIVAHEAIFSK